jgi:hypothetical protein
MDYKPEKDTNRSEFENNDINVYDNDDAYMLNDDERENTNNMYSLDELQEDDINAARGYRNEVKSLTDEETVRNNPQTFHKHEEEGILY